MKNYPLKLQIVPARGNPHIPFLRRHLKNAHARLRPALSDLSIALVGAGRMSRLHEKFMGIAGPTDVLTFELEHDSRGKVTGGEVIICTTQAARQARRRGIHVRLELLLYALHGMLHLCGWDDKTTRGFAAMHEKEDEILTAIGIGPVFRPRHRMEGK